MTVKNVRSGVRAVEYSGRRDLEARRSEYMRQHMEQGAKNVKRYFDRRSTGEDAVRQLE